MRRALSALLIAWLAAVVVVAITREVDHLPHLAGLASTPDGILHARLWTLLSSALPVSRYPALEILGLAGALAGVARVAGIGTVWIVGLAAHVGATLVTYAGIGVLWLADRGAARPFVHRLDYGISAVWLGELGCLATLLWDRNRRLSVGVGLMSLAVSVGLLPVAGEIATAEHLLALTIGLLAPITLRHVLRLDPAPPAPARSAA